MSAPVKLYGSGILNLPIGFNKASSKEEQIDMLYNAADSGNISKSRAEQYLRLIKKLEKQSNPSDVRIRCKSIRFRNGRIIIER